MAACVVVKLTHPSSPHRNHKNRSILTQTALAARSTATSIMPPKLLAAITHTRSHVCTGTPVGLGAEAGQRPCHLLTCCGQGGNLPTTRRPQPHAVPSTVADLHDRASKGDFPRRSGLNVCVGGSVGPPTSIFSTIGDRLSTSPTPRCPSATRVMWRPLCNYTNRFGCQTIIVIQHRV